ncbi:RimK family alpha-L-glutamate ligase [Desulfobulbus sp. TB]|nr:RimK family alpha-L-glutamate ligase [Desulfobulbus sp. TB]
MKGWILYKDSATILKPELYEIKRFLEVAQEENIDLKVLKPEQFDLTVTREDNQSLLIDGHSAELPDFVLPRMGAGTTYFTLAIIRHLERLGVYCVNSSQSIETVKDKLYTQQILAQNNLPVPKTMLVKFPFNVDLVERHLGFPVVVKTLSGSQGSGVFLSETKSSFMDLMQLIEATNRTSNIILQEFVADSKGKDLRVITIGGRVISSMQRIARNGEFKSNYSAGGKVKQFPMTPEIEWMATQTSHILGLEIAGIDLLFDGKHYKVCEANSATAFEGMESCCDVNIAKEVFHFIRIRQGIFKKTVEVNDNKLKSKKKPKC